MRIVITGEYEEKMKKIVKLRKQGNSLIITIPKEQLDILKWNENDYVLLETKDAEKSYFGSTKTLNVEKVTEEK